MLNASCRTISAAFAGVAVAAAISILPCEVRAENKISVSTFRATAESGSSDAVAGACGTVVLGRHDAKQSFEVGVHNLAGSGYGVFRGDTFSTNFPVFLIAAMDQNDPTNNSWSLKFTSISGAPPQLGVADVTNLVGKIIYIATLGATNITGVGTNLVGCTTNIVGGVTNLVGCTTNIVDAVTNIIVGAVLWAPVPPLVANPGKESFNKKAVLVSPPGGPSPRSRGKIETRYSGTRGQSVLEIRAMLLPRGHPYAVWMEDGLSYTNIGSLTLSGGSGRFIRDTRKGLPLPLEVPFVDDLSGRNILIRDEFGEVHLVGPIP